MKILSALSFLCCLTLGTHLLAQGGTSPWSLTFYYAPQHVSYHSPQRTVFASDDLLPQPSFSFNVGVGLTRKLTTKWALRTGVSFLSASQESLDKPLRWGNETDGNGGFAGNDPDNPDRLSFREYQYFLQVPVGVEYHFWQNGPWRAYAVGGFQWQHLLSRRTGQQQDFADGQVFNAHDIGEADNLRTTNVEGFLAVGFAWTYKQRVSVLVEPEAGMGFRGVAIDAPYTTRRYRLGLRVGLQLSF